MNAILYAALAVLTFQNPSECALIRVSETTLTVRTHPDDETLLCEMINWPIDSPAAEYQCYDKNRHIVVLPTHVIFDGKRYDATNDKKDWNEFCDDRSRQAD